MARAVEAALRAGYHSIDCAYAYGNEAEIGEALQKCFKEGVVKREEVFITSKLWYDIVIEVSSHRPDQWHMVFYTTVIQKMPKLSSVDPIYEQSFLFHSTGAHFMEGKMFSLAARSPSRTSSWTIWISTSYTDHLP